ncbi:hypothetical protein ACFX19_020416 [Malus domestica]
MWRNSKSLSSKFQISNNPLYLLSSASSSAEHGGVRPLLLSHSLSQSHPIPLPLRLQILPSSGFTDPMESERFRQRLISRRWLPGPRTWPVTMGSAIGSSPKLASAC